MANNPLAIGSIDAWGLNNGYAPQEGPKCIPVTFDFTSVTSQAFDLVTEIANGKMSYVQALFIDNSLNPQPVSIVAAVTGQKLVVPPYNQGYLPCLTPDDPRFVISTTGGVVVPIEFLNFPVPAQMWNALGTQTVQVTGTNLAYLLSGNNQPTPELVGTSIACGTISGASTQSPIIFYNGSQFPFITGINLQLSGDATLAAAGRMTATVYGSGGGPNMAEAVVYLPSAIPANPVPNYTILNLTDMQLVNSSVYAIYISISSALATGVLTYNIYGGQTSHTANG